MPRIVAITGYVGLAFWLFALAVFVYMIRTPAPAGGPPADAETDRIVLPCLVIVGAMGAGSALGMLSHSPKAYQGFVRMIDLTALVAGLMAVASPHSWTRAAWATGICGALLLTRSRLVTASVRDYFGLPPITRKHLAAPGWLNLGVGIFAIAFVGWALPTPMFGHWLERQHVIVVTIVFGASNAVLGWGMLSERKWIGPLTIALGIASILYEAGLAWNPNPLGRLGEAEAMTRQSILTSTIFSIAFSSWTWWRIRRHERERAPTPVAGQNSHQ